MTEHRLAMRTLRNSATCFVLSMALACGSFGMVWAQNVPTAPVASAQPARAWQQLPSKEKLALAPLASRWSELSEIQKGKWIAISQNFDQLSPAEKLVMHERMADWVNLSPIQRNQARLNFNALQNLPKDEKKAKWDEYQSLSTEQKRQLSSVNQGPAKTTAPSSKPANAERLVPPPAAWQTSPAPTAMPSRGPIDKKTLLPIPNEVSAKPAPTPPEPASPRDDASSS